MRFSPAERRSFYHRRELERAGSKLIRAADRQRRQRAPAKPDSDSTANSLPKKLTFADLKELRRLKLVP